MKKLTSLVLATGMVLSLAACGGSSRRPASPARRFGDRPADVSAASIAISGFFLLFPTRYPVSFAAVAPLVSGMCPAMSSFGSGWRRSRLRE